MSAITLHRRWFRFSLRTLLILVAVLAVPCAWMGGEINRVRNMRRAIEIVERHHGAFEYDYQRPNGLEGSVDPKAEVKAPRWLRRLIGDDYFRSIGAIQFDGDSGSNPATLLLEEEWAVIGLQKSLRALWVERLPIRDESFRHLRGLTNLEYLAVRDSLLTDRSTYVMARFQRLKYLCLGNYAPLPEGPRFMKAPSRFTDKSLEQIGRLKNLTVLELDGARITDAGLAHLQGLKRLDSLFVRSTEIGDAGMVHLLNLPLSSLDLQNSKLTNNGARLLTTMPTLISFDTFEEFDEDIVQVFQQRLTADAAKRATANTGAAQTAAGS